jgi:hypothetical protein
MSHIEPHPHPAAGVYAPTKSVHEASIDKTGAGTYVSSENDHAVSPVMGNEVLEHDAQTKGRWFQYVKTKQFWITLLLGQGELVLYYQFSITNWMIIRYWDWWLMKCNSPRHLRHIDEYLILATFRRGHVDSRVPIFLQLRPA